MEVEEWTWTTRDARIGVAGADVSEETGSIPQLVISPVETRFMTLDCSYQCSTPKAWISLFE